RSNNLHFNFDLVMAEMTRWPRLTVIVLTIFAAEFVFIPSALPADAANMSAEDKALLLGGMLFGFLTPKTLLLLSLYPLLRDRPFTGSYLLTSFIACVPFLATLLIGAYLEHKNSAFIMVPVGYVVCALAVAPFMGVSHGMIVAHEDQWRANVV